MRKNREKLQTADYRANFPVDSGTAYIREYRLMKAKQLSVTEVVELMRKRQGDKTQREFAEELGVSQQYLCDVYLGKRDPGDSILKGLGIVRRTVYEPVA